MGVALNPEANAQIRSLFCREQGEKREKKWKRKKRRKNWKEGRGRRKNERRTEKRATLTCEISVHTY
jgi:hypothetical protein